MTDAEKLEAIKKLHTKYRLYRECEHGDQEDDPKHHEGRPTIYIEEIGYTCGEPCLIVCRECHLDGGETTEFTECYEWPCSTMEIVEAGG